MWWDEGRLCMNSTLVWFLTTTSVRVCFVMNFRRFCALCILGSAFRQDVYMREKKTFVFTKFHRSGALCMPLQALL